MIRYEYEVVLFGSDKLVKDIFPELDTLVEKIISEKGVVIYG